LPQQSGALAVDGGRDIAHVINSLLQLPFVLKIATKDWHPADHVSFASNHLNGVAFVTEISITNPNDPTQTETTLLWPDHCLQGSAGADLVAELDVSRIDHIVEKGQDKRVEMYSAFADPFETHVSKSGLERLLKDTDISHVYCVGLAMDFCVKFTALDAAKAGFKTYVISEATKAVNPAKWDEVLATLKEGKVEVVGIGDKELDAVRSLAA
jgi:nicotinamidase-related amidase